MRCMADKAVASQFSRRLLAPRRRPQRLPARYAADSEIGVRPLRKIEAELVHRRSRSVTQDARSSAAINLKRKRGRCDATALRDDERPRRRGTTERQQVLNENLRRFNQYVVALREVAAPEHLGALLDGTGLPARISRRCSPMSRRSRTATGVRRWRLGGHTASSRCWTSGSPMLRTCHGARSRPHSRCRTWATFW